MNHVIQARITIAQKNKEKCALCKRGKGKYLYTSYEVSNAGVELLMQTAIRTFKRREQAEQFAAETPLNDLVYEATYREQLMGPPIVHLHDYSCYHCLSSFISKGMNISQNYGAIVLSRLREGGAIWIMREVTATDKWAMIETPHQDVARLREDLQEAQTISFTSVKGERYERK